VPDREWAEVAGGAFRSLLERHGASELLVERRPAEGDPVRYAHVWPYSQVVMACLELAGSGAPISVYDCDPARRVAALEHYFDPLVGGYLPTARPPGPPSGDLYYDDNAWVGLALVQWFLLTHDRAVLVRAAQLFSLIVAAWDGDPRRPLPGGIPWTRAPGQATRNTCSTGPAAELGASLYLVTGERRYLEWARALEAWASTALLGEDGLYADHIEPDGGIDPTRWSYNQGSLIAANALLHRASGDGEHLRRAQDVARASLAHYTGLRLVAQPPWFNAIFLRGLLVLHATSPAPAFTSALHGYAETLRRDHVNASTGEVTGGDRELDVLLQAGVIQVFALAAWPEHRHHLLV
jgi:hypothetical protein